jgi:hypothetical protein
VLEPGRKIANIEFALIPQAVITGKVIDEDGEPVPHTMVTVLRRTPLARQPMGMMGMSTNDVGEFRIAGLAPGRYVIRAERRGPMFGAATRAGTDGKGEGTLDYVPTWYPGVTDEASAGEITAAAGQHLPGMDIRLRKGRVFQVSGRIGGVPGDSSRIQVSLQPRRTGRGGMIFGFGGGGNGKPDGTFTLPSVTPGSWDVVAMNLESGRPQMLGRAPVTGQVLLQPMQPLPMFMQPVRIQEDGSFKISGVSRDHFRVDVIGLSGDQYVKSVRAGNVDVTTSGLDLSAADTAPPVEIRVSAKGAAVSGVVLDGTSLRPAQSSSH